MNFKLLNIPVCIHPTFWIFLLTFTNLYRDLSIYNVILGGVLIFSLLVHEYGHALTALYFGAQPIVSLEAFGGNAQYDSYGITPKQQFWITLNGPLLESVLILLSYFILRSGVYANHPYIQYTLYVTMRLNILWCLLNLIPIAPLDGGHLARYLLERKFGPAGYRASIIMGLVCAAMAAPYLYFQGYLFFAILLLIFGFQNFRAMQQEGSASRSENPFSSYIRGIESLNNNETEKAKQILKKLLKSKDIPIKHSAIESLAKIYCQENESQKAYDLLLKADPERLKEGKCLLCKLAFERKNYGLVGKYANDIYAIDPSYEIAFLNSQAFAHLNDTALADAWLTTSSQFRSPCEKNER